MNGVSVCHYTALRNVLRKGEGVGHVTIRRLVKHRISSLSSTLNSHCYIHRCTEEQDYGTPELEHCREV